MKTCTIKPIDALKMEKSIWSQVDDSKENLDLNFIDKEF
jgi:hypothetical protein